MCHSRTSLYQHAFKSIDSTQVVDKRKFNKGRKTKKSITKGGKNYFTSIHKLREESGSFAIKRLRLVSSLGNKVCETTVRSILKKEGVQISSF